jgi:DNA topoisomerase-1
VLSLPTENGQNQKSMQKNLVIVESPAKAKTIEGYLGKDFIVKSSFGHVRDLPSKDISIDIEHDFAPNYVVPKDKKKLVSELKKLSDNAETVWLATDEDREGEAISWHLAEALGIADEKIKRIVFHEITKSAILNAIEKPRKIDINLVNAQQARRVLDRLVGYEMSPILWRKIKPSLSAGRVQSVAVRIIVEREQEIRSFKPKATFRIMGEFVTQDGNKIKAELDRKLATWEEANSVLASTIESSFSVSDVESKPAKKSPVAPFTTSTLQQEASRKMGYSVAQTMALAQKLYESGKITYMRTDSVNLSDLALNEAESMIRSSYGDDYSKRRKYSTKSKGAQEAHEAIRPVDISQKEVQMDDNRAIRLYDLIWKRTIASQMADAQLERTTMKISGSTMERLFVAKGEVIKFDGFLKVYMEGKDDVEEEESGNLPQVKVGEALDSNEINAIERFSHHPPRYTEASLVKKMEELGIGRPSTYAPTISTIQKRGYVEKKSTEGKKQSYRFGTMKDNAIAWLDKTENTGAEKNKLFPTDIGVVVNDFLVEHFARILDYYFTADVEKQFDEIADGEIVWYKMINDFYKPFHIDVEQTLENSEKATGQRDLGVDPKSGKPVIARIGRFGPMIQIGESTDEDKPKFASLREGQTIQDITFEEAMKLFDLPRTLGEFEGKPVLASIGRFGPYIKVLSTFVSIHKDSGLKPEDITLEEAMKLYEDKLEADRKKLISEFKEDATLKVLNGRYGPFIKFGKKNIKIPKDKDAEKLTYEDCVEIIKAAPEPKKRK